MKTIKAKINASPTVKASIKVIPFLQPEEFNYNSLNDILSKIRKYQETYGNDIIIEKIHCEKGKAEIKFIINKNK